jgi:hypothetical protein
MKDAIIYVFGMDILLLDPGSQEVLRLISFAKIL